DRVECGRFRGHRTDVSTLCGRQQADSARRPQSRNHRNTREPSAISVEPRGVSSAPGTSPNIESAKRQADRGYVHVLNSTIRFFVFSKKKGGRHKRRPLFESVIDRELIRRRSRVRPWSAAQRARAAAQVSTAPSARQAPCGASRRVTAG